MFLNVVLTCDKDYLQYYIVKHTYSCCQIVTSLNLKESCFFKLEQQLLRRRSVTQLPASIFGNTEDAWILGNCENLYNTPNSKN